MSTAWQDPAWLAAAHAWIEDELERLGIRHSGDIEQPHVYPWSTVLRVPTDDGVVWFKANADAFGTRPRSSSCSPGSVPTPSHRCWPGSPTAAGC